MPEQFPVTRTHGLPSHLITKFCKGSEPFRKHSDKNQTRKQKEASQKTVQGPGAARSSSQVRLLPDLCYCTTSQGGLEVLETPHLFTI